MRDDLSEEAFRIAFPRSYDKAGGSLAVGEGWYPLLWELHEILEPLVPDLFRVEQVKEKFGGLRFYISYDAECSGEVDQAMYRAIDWAEQRSYTICESCGRDGKLRKGGWLKTLCDSCAER